MEVVTRFSCEYRLWKIDRILLLYFADRTLHDQRYQNSLRYRGVPHLRAAGKGEKNRYPDNVVIQLYRGLP